MKLESINRKVCVIGGGPAGLSCSLWLKYLGLTPIILEKEDRLGGLQNASHFVNAWYMGLPGRTGREIAEEFSRHAAVENLPVLLRVDIRGIERAGEGFVISANDAQWNARSVVLCTGQHIRRFAYVEAIEGSAVLRDSPCVCFDPGQTPLKLPQVAGRRIAVIGGGDNGLVTAASLSSVVEHVDLIARSKLHGFGHYRRAVAEGMESGRIAVHEHAAIVRFGNAGQGIEISLLGSSEPIRTDFVFFRLGFTPNVAEIQWLLEAGGIGRLELAASRHIRVDERSRTSIPGFTQWATWPIRLILASLLRLPTARWRLGRSRRIFGGLGGRRTLGAAEKSAIGWPEGRTQCRGSRPPI